jgi:hypothetical protein
VATAADDSGESDSPSVGLCWQGDLYRQRSPELGQNIDLKGHNAILSDFRFEHRAAA